jgi:DNA-binding IclR family transcriptional regulator
MLRTLLEERFIEQDAATRLYRLGPGVLELAQSFLRQSGLIRIAMSHLERLRDATGETVCLQILDGRESVCIAAVESLHPIRVDYYIGERMPLYCTSSGYAFLAGMTPASRKALLSSKLHKHTPKTIVSVAKIEDAVADTLRKGMGFSDEGYVAGARAISAPIHGPSGDVIAVVTMVAPSQRMSLKQVPTLGQTVRETAARISGDVARVGTLDSSTLKGGSLYRPYIGKGLHEERRPTRRRDSLEESILRRRRWSAR